ncbi:MAG: hypothetical protein QW035_01145 [Candidatus Anstonellales archaeon]
MRALPKAFAIFFVLLFLGCTQTPAEEIKPYDEAAVKRCEPGVYKTISDDGGIDTYIKVESIGDKCRFELRFNTTIVCLESLGLRNVDKMSCVADKSVLQQEGRMVWKTSGAELQPPKQYIDLGIGGQVEVPALPIALSCRQVCKE